MNEWIYTADQMPPAYKRLLVTIQAIGDEPLVDIGVYSTATGVWEQAKTQYQIRGEVVAWMELPEPAGAMVGLWCVKAGGRL